MARTGKNIRRADLDLRSAFGRSGDATFSGFVVNLNDLTRKFTVELVIDNDPVLVQRADGYVHELAGEIGDGCYGFSFALPAATINNGCMIEARIANLGVSIGAPLHCDATPRQDPDGPGEIRWLGGLRFSGWLGGGAADAISADVLVNGELMLRVRPSGWTQIGATPEQSRAVHALDFHLPDRLADGRVHRVSLVTASGETLAGSPLPIVAFPGGLARALSSTDASLTERMQGELFDRINPMSLPFSSYRRWRDSLPAETRAPTGTPCAVVLVGPGNVEPTLQSLHEQTHSDWIAVSIPTAARRLEFDPSHLRSFLVGDGHACAIVVFALAGTFFAPTALARFVATFEEFEAAQVVYGDVDLAGADGVAWPIAFPAIDYERMLEQGYCAHLFAMGRAAVESASSSRRELALSPVQCAVRRP